MIKSIGGLTLNVNTKKKVSDISFNTYGKILEDIKPQINLLVHWVESQWGGLSIPIGMKLGTLFFQIWAANTIIFQ